MQGIGKTSEEIFSEAKDSAELRLKRMLVVDTLADDTDASVSGEEVTAEIALMKQLPQYANENLETDEAKDAVQRILRRRNAIDQVIEVTHKPKTAKKTTGNKATTKESTVSKSTAEKPAAKKASTSKKAAKK